LPGLIGASVCSTLLIVKPLGAWIWRCRAEITPVVSVRSRSNGFPIAYTGSPTWAPLDPEFAEAGWPVYRTRYGLHVGDAIVALRGGDAIGIDHRNASHQGEGGKSLFELSHRCRREQIARCAKMQNGRLQLCNNVPDRSNVGRERQRRALRR